MSAYWFNSVQRDSTQETLISENRVFIQTNSHGTFLWILMPVCATLASQELLRHSPSLTHCVTSSQLVGGISVPQGILTASFSAGSVSGFTGDTQWWSREGVCSQAAPATTSGSRMDSDSVVSDGWGGEQGFGFWPEFIYTVVTSPLLLSTLSP
jgi:hypothetical protein